VLRQARDTGTQPRPWAYGGNETEEGHKLLWQPKTWLTRAAVSCPHSDHHAGHTESALFAESRAAKGASRCGPSCCCWQRCSLWDARTEGGSLVTQRWPTCPVPHQKSCKVLQDSPPNAHDAHGHCSALLDLACSSLPCFCGTRGCQALARFQAREANASQAQHTACVVSS